MFDTGSRVRSAYGSGSNRTPSLKPRHMRSCNVRVLPNPRVTLWFRRGCAATSARHRFNIEEKRRGAVARALAPVGAPLLVDRERGMLKTVVRADRLGR